MKILAIETSCDETAVATLEITGPKTNQRFRVLSNTLSSQTKLHAKFGGIVPNLARREHEKNLVPILIQALREAKLGSCVKKIPSRHSRPPLSRRRNPRLHQGFSGQAVSLMSGSACPPELQHRWRFPINPAPSGWCWIKSGMTEKSSSIELMLQREPELLTQFKKSIVPLAVPDIDVIAVTYGPGLAPALWVGVNFARALSHLWQKPLIPVNHMAGHFYSALFPSHNVIPAQAGIQAFQDEASGFPIRSGMTREKKYKIQKIKFPALVLLVSGGHTELVLVRKHGDFKIIGATLDDAAGEAFDKVARILGLPYPGGPALSRIADSFRHPERREEPLTEIPRFTRNNKVHLPRPMLNSKDYNFSFSGLKTAVLYLVRDLKRSGSVRKLRPIIAWEFQNAVVDVLVAKTIRAAKEFKVKTVTLGGGVAANEMLRRELARTVKKELPGSDIRFPDFSLTGDNALMIALAAYFCGKKTSPDKVQADANVAL